MTAREDARSGGVACFSLPTPALSGSGSMGISQQHNRVTPQRVESNDNETRVLFQSKYARMSWLFVLQHGVVHRKARILAQSSAT